MVQAAVAYRPKCHWVSITLFIVKTRLPDTSHKLSSRVTNVCMKTIVFTTVLITLLAGCQHHPKIDRDKLVAEICQSFKEDDRIDETDEIKIDRILSRHIDKYTYAMPDDSARALRDFVYVRLQRECREFREIVHHADKKNKKSDWAEVDLEPESQASKEDCDAFFNAGKLKYLEATGDTVVVNITSSIWEDRFPDGTYSRLSLQRTKQDEFVITFIESDNSIRKNMSHPGDQYRYKIIKKEGDTFSMFVEVVGPKLRSLFKMYY